MWVPADSQQMQAERHREGQFATPSPRDANPLWSVATDLREIGNLPLPARNMTLHETGSGSWIADGK
jgi:hypothetical protein